MNGINRHNYEAFLLDSIEGRLTAEQQLELDAFMALNPDLVLDLEDLADVTFDPQQTFFQEKASLKRTESDLVPEEQFIAYIEQQLSPEEKLDLEKSCDANPVLAKELNLYQSTIAVADTGIVFEDKESLKRRSKVILFNYRTASFAAAASVVFLIMLYAIWPSKTADVRFNTYAHASERKTGSKIELLANAGDAESEAQTKKLTQYGLEHGPCVNQKPEFKKLLAQNNSTTNITTTTVSVNVPDTNSRMATVKNQEPLPKKEPVLIASASQKTVVEVITENDDDADEVVKKKQGFWALAGKTLKGLNKAGVKTVDGKEETTKENASYDLTLGGLSITHKAH
jgi:hypothetical protein